MDDPQSQLADMFLKAYRQGAFPMADITDAPATDQELPEALEIHWYRPKLRGILPLENDALRVPSGIARTIRRQRFTMTCDTQFGRVIRECARPRPSHSGGQWLDQTLVDCYTLLHGRQLAHSIEAWKDIDGQPELVGGLYGLSIGGVFCAESMFTALERGGSGASSACLVTLWHHLRSCGYDMLDVQMANPHTQQFGVIEITDRAYLRRIKTSMQREDCWRPLSSTLGS